MQFDNTLDGSAVCLVYNLSLLCCSCMLYTYPTQIKYSDFNYDIPVEKRADWIKKLYPNVNVILAKNPPSKYGMDEESIKIQTDYLKKVLGDVPGTHFFSSEEYGKFVARDLNVENRVVDYKREFIPISGTKVRANIDEYANFVNKIVYNDIKDEKKS